MFLVECVVGIFLLKIPEFLSFFLSLMQCCFFDCVRFKTGRCTLGANMTDLGQPWIFGSPSKDVCDLFGQVLLESS